MVQLKQAKTLKEKKFEIDFNSTFISKRFKSIGFNKNLGQFQQELKMLEEDLAMYRLQKDYNKNFNPLYYFGCLAGSIFSFIYAVMVLIHM